jgi:hypothetical protein
MLDTTFSMTALGTLSRADFDISILLHILRLLCGLVDEFRGSRHNRARNESDIEPVLKALSVKGFWLSQPSRLDRGIP